MPGRLPIPFNPDKKSAILKALKEIGCTDIDVGDRLIIAKSDKYKLYIDNACIRRISKDGSCYSRLWITKETPTADILKEFLKCRGANDLKNGKITKALWAYATASAERKWKFKDGSIITASTAEEARAKHKVIAAEEKEFRITWSSEIFIKAKSKSGAKRKFDDLGLFSADALDLGAECIEINSVEEQ